MKRVLLLGVMILMVCSPLAVSYAEDEVYWEGITPAEPTITDKDFRLDFKTPAAKSLGDLEIYDQPKDIFEEEESAEPAPPAASATTDCTGCPGRTAASPTHTTPQPDPAFGGCFSTYPPAPHRDPPRSFHSRRKPARAPLNQSSSAGRDLPLPKFSRAMKAGVHRYPLPRTNWTGPVRKR